MARIDSARTRERLAASTELGARARGDVLEDVIADSFVAVPGVELVSRASKNVGQSREIDLAFRVRLSEGGLEHFGSELLVECKNWDRAVGSSEIAWFVTKLRRAGLNVGVLVAANGITGDPSVPTAAFAELRDARAEQVTVVVLERAEIEAVESGEQLARVLERKRFLMKVHNRYVRASVALDPPALPERSDRNVVSRGPMPKPLSLAVQNEVVGDAQRVLALGEFHRRDGDSQLLDRAVGDLSRLLDDEGVRVDAVLSVGDLAWRGAPSELSLSWRDLLAIKDRVGAPALVATPGNHDRARLSRGAEFSNLIDLAPPFPITSSATQTDRFLARGFAIYDSPPLRIVVINTEIEPSSDTHVIDVRLPGRLTKALSAGGERQANILLSHRLIDQCAHGSELAASLDPAVHGPWVHVHGSVHGDFVSYSTAGANRMTGVALQPLAGALWGERALIGGASAALLEIPMSRTWTGLDLVGRFQAWSWRPSVGWVPAPNIPGGSAGGFGFRASFPHLTSEVGRALAESPDGWLSWSLLASALPHLAFLAPADVVKLMSELEAQGIRVFTDAHGEPVLNGTGHTGS